MGVTLRDLASHCDVDVSTVSRALRDDPRVKYETRKTVQDVAKELGYRPNLAAKSLVEGRTRTIWLVTSVFVHNSFGELIRHACQYLNKHGYDILVAPYDHDDPQAYGRILSRLGQGIADGALIIPPVNEETPGDLKPLIESNYPVVFLDRRIENLDTYTVTSDNKKGGVQLARACLKEGVRGMVVDFTLHNSVGRSRREGAITELKKWDCPWWYADEIVEGLELPNTLGILSTGYTPLQSLLGQKADHFQGKRLFFGVFDHWEGEPYPGEKAFVCIQDFKTMMEKGCEQILELIDLQKDPKKKKTTKKKTKSSLITRIPFKETLTITRRF